MKNLLTKLTFILIGINLISQVSTRDITNEEIKDAILSLVHSYNLLDNKLERHEHRERALGELVKRALQSLQKGQKAYEPMNGIFSRLDERVSQIETMLIAQEDKYNVQTDKLSEALENIFKWMSQNTACTKPGGSYGESNLKLEEKIEKMSKEIKDQTEISKNLLHQSEKLMAANLSLNEDIMSKLEAKLSNGSLAQNLLAKKENLEFENNIKYQLEQIVANITELKETLLTKNKLSLFDQELIEKLSNTTLSEIFTTKQELLATVDKLFVKTTSEINTSTAHLENNIQSVLTNLKDYYEVINKLHIDLNQSYSSLHDSFEVFNKFDKVLLLTSEYVLDTQRKIEYGTHQILQKTGELIRQQHSDLNNTLQRRFDSIDNSILNNHLEALQNLSSTMESEISHVWRQIEIMHTEISYSKDALNKLQGQTENYVNGTFNTMDSMEGKVSHITERMSEIDSNLNYLLGKLSLVTQEFNQIKSGLGNALDQIRSSFKTVQDKIQDVGPGPHVIPNDKYETDINLLPQQPITKP